ncbi:hypothetical protein TVAG_097730 [Trichomonas vaginalis G3]|uniref:Uncharacterized protein n=1 Tax=Trichomonas vaginalis (strain ATCC PRA-98 / G3) TaxID=412133 RepID=A2E2A3_TRIV3|nr:hypothetical protein TVAGG3_0964910 [Trichomonas vaginalis G3]EAY13203.1 hypothetical protein TVAG_097730 [Trichomonas vaginalis G3]KAI5488171.1 hypothetical protein TVAGG3_0964910 [Trichomonas vaginalis G3]|eukprot:XP_001325426.1 hypothetical protein [Trichomonas vaginalis G3]
MLFALSALALSSRVVRVPYSEHYFPSRPQKHYFRQTPEENFNWKDFLPSHIIDGPIYKDLIRLQEQESNFQLPKHLPNATHINISRLAKIIAHHIATNKTLPMWRPLNWTELIRPISLKGLQKQFSVKKQEANSYFTETIRPILIKGTKAYFGHKKNEANSYWTEVLRPVILSSTRARLGLQDAETNSAWTKYIRPALVAGAKAKLGLQEAESNSAWTKYIRPALVAGAKAKLGLQEAETNNHWKPHYPTAAHAHKLY